MNVWYLSPNCTGLVWYSNGVGLCLVVKWSGIQMVVSKPDWKNLIMVQNVRYLNGLPSHVTLPFEYRTPFLYTVQMIWYSDVQYAYGYGSNCWTSNDIIAGNGRVLKLYFFIVRFYLLKKYIMWIKLPWTKKVPLQRNGMAAIPKMHMFFGQGLTDMRF